MSAPTQALVRRFGPFEVDLRSGEVRKNGIRLRLSGQPFQILALLVERPGEVVSREELHSKLWPADTFVDFDHGLNNAVARIREVLADSCDTPRYVETVPRRGYRFIAPMADLEPAMVPAAGAAGHGVSIPAALPAERKGISIYVVVPFGAATVLAVVALAFLLYRSGAKAVKPPSIKSLAVLPLKNLSGDPAQDYLAEGITEELIGRLAAIRDLRVISRTSVMRFKDTQLSVPEISKMLGVDAIVEGSILREGSRIRVHAQLIRAATDEHLWSETYDRELPDVLALESHVAESIALKVEVTVSGPEKSRLVNAHPVSPEVYESYLRGLFALSKGNRSDIEESIRHFEQATQTDPTFAPAYVGLASAYDSLSLVFVGAPPGEMRPKVTSAAHKALELDPGLAEAHVLLAGVYQKQWQWSDAEAEYQRALELRPNDAAAHIGFARWLLSKGRTEESLEWAKRAREIDPISVSGANLGWILFQARRYDEASRELHAALAVEPDKPMALWFLGFVLVAQGKPDDAIPVLEKAVSASQGSPGGIGVLVRAYARAGRRAEALHLLDELKRRRQKTYVPAAAFVQAYLGLGDNDQAFAWLEQAYKEKSNLLQWVKVEPTFDPLRGDPRFIELIHRVGLD